MTNTHLFRIPFLLPLWIPNRSHQDWTILLEANAVDGVFSSLVNNSGLIGGGSLTSAGGCVTLTSADDTWGADSNEDVFVGMLGYSRDESAGD